MNWDLLVMAPFGLLGILFSAFAVAEGCLAVAEKWRGGRRADLAEEC